MDPAADLARIDQHSVVVDATPRATWNALARVVEGSFSSGPGPGAARVLGCADTEAAGPRPLSVGSAFPGFHVAEADPPKALSLLGSHRFSTYELTFGLEDLGQGRTGLLAATRADFPGLKGGIYRALVIGTGIHVLVTRAMLGAIRRRAERA
jgi:hypothetical protein